MYNCYNDRNKICNFEMSRRENYNIHPLKKKTVEVTIGQINYRKSRVTGTNEDDRNKYKQAKLISKMIVGTQ